jgi:MFS family permease
MTGDNIGAHAPAGALRFVKSGARPSPLGHTLGPPVLIEERSAALRVPQAPSGTALARARVNGAVLLVAGCVLLAALSLLLPSAPTYDPWAWIIWGREVAHLDLVTTLGPSWKPLPVAFTTIFSLFGSWAPDLWLVVARAGALAAVFLAFRVARGLGGGVVGGVAAACALAIAPWWIRSGALGNSEGLIVAFLLGAIDRHMAGERRFAFWLAVCAGLVRPEAWPFLAVYGALLMWTRSVPVRVVLGAGVGVLALWLLPEWWGSGDLLRAMHRAKDVNPGAPTYADDPAREVLHDAGLMLTTPLVVGLLLAGVMVMVKRSKEMATLIAMAIAWLGLVAYMTSDGFSGNQRYLMAPVSLLMVLGGAGIGWGLSLIVTAVPALRDGALPRRAGVAGLVVASIVVGVVFAAPSFNRFAPNLRGLQYQADLADELPGLVRDAGGADALKRCGNPYTGPFLVPVVAWNLHMHTKDVQLTPARPAVVFRVKTTAHSRPGPSLAAVGDDKTLATGDNWRIVAACGGGAGG